MPPPRWNMGLTQGLQQGGAANHARFNLNTGLPITGLPITGLPITGLPIIGLHVGGPYVL